MVRFEWDSAKERDNYKKHRVSFYEACSVFYDEFAVQFFDEEHSSDEDRFLMLGISGKSRMLMICHCQRELGEAIRVISARKATRNESKFYPGGT